MAQPTPQEIQQQWEKVALFGATPPFHQVDYTAPALAKWAYEKGVNDAQKICVEHRITADRMVDTATAQRDEAFAKLDALKKENAELKQTVFQLESSVRYEKERTARIMKLCDEHRVNYIAKSDAAIRERDKARSELAFVRRDRDMAEGQVANQREAIASLNRQIAANARELAQKTDSIRTLNAQLVDAQKRAEALKEDLKFERENNAVREEQQSRDGYWPAWKAVWDTLAGVTGNFSGYRGTGLEMAVKAIKGLKKDLDEANKDFDGLVEVVKSKQATIDAMNDLENKTIKSLRESLADCTHRNDWQAAELNRMAKKFCGRPWDQTLSV